MPRYAFVSQSGTRFNIKMMRGEYAERVKDGKLKWNGQTLTAVGSDRPLAGVVGTNPGNYPMRCESLAVDPDQIRDRVAEDARLGVGGTEYTKGGTPIMRDKSHYKAYRRAYGFHFRNGIES